MYISLQRCTSKDPVKDTCLGHTDNCSLKTRPRGPWTQTHRTLSAAGEAKTTQGLCGLSGQNKFPSKECASVCTCVKVHAFTAIHAGQQYGRWEGIPTLSSRVLNKFSVCPSSDYFQLNSPTDKSQMFSFLLPSPNLLFSPSQHKSSTYVDHKLRLAALGDRQVSIIAVERQRLEDQFSFRTILSSSPETTQGGPVSQP